ncbi:DUF1906 domain-containing protein [Streptomyces sp. B1866]|uniref:DUF1906 domain-containing protein n=1 Tax=Streptomyces sp. B1866 TaxID=3075431 RepID=UPI0028915CC0|nr:DUF1906 domain-containing protein [Streptomyces sp. B1866]MDT3398643.1 DUF1906 domain-containing protein [Streptomyces sp. B1866]
MDRRKKSGWTVIRWAAGAVAVLAVLVGATMPAMAPSVRAQAPTRAQAAQPAAPAFGPWVEAMPAQAAQAQAQARAQAAGMQPVGMQAAGMQAAGAQAAGAQAVGMQAAGAPAPAYAQAQAQALPALADPRVHGAQVFNGWAFDTCHTPALGTLTAWRSSRYRGIGVYYAGRGRACRHQPRLNRSWTRGAKKRGWRVLPIYVGSQPPCVHSKRKRKVAIRGDGWKLGRREGRDAVSRARALGMKSRSALYLDMEAYDPSRTSCARTTLAYIRGWDREARSHGYFPGFYSSAGAGVRHVEKARRSGVRDLPSAVWFARWRVKPSLKGEPALAHRAWTPHRRVHQYAGDVSEKHGGRRLRVDRNKVDAPVAIIER